jgi:DNA-binding NarL/FixJ family response regulator
MIVGEHSLSRAFIRAWVSGLKGLVVLAEASGQGQALVLVGQRKPDLVLVDLETQQGADLGLLVKLQARYPAVKVIVYLAYAHESTAIKVIRAGAAGFVVKSAQASEMEDAIRTVMAGGVYLSPELLRFVGRAESLTDRDGKLLSSRQAEILKLIALGLSTKSIAFELGINGKTVDLHKQSLAKRVGLKRPGELFKYALGAGLAMLKA